MSHQQIKELLQDRLLNAFQRPVTSLSFSPVGGGSINEAYRVKLNNRTDFFLKLNSDLFFPRLFEKERNGLAFLAKQKSIRTPSVILCDTHENHQLLLLEWIEPGTRTIDFWKKFGELLSQLHHSSQHEFGFDEDNYMGSLPQSNHPTTDWVDFFANQRLRPQIEMAGTKGYLDSNQIDAFDRLFRKLDAIFDPENPSLLHGDLWSGNFMCDDRSMPVLVDPAVYFGHRSMDLAMTTLFGGFDKSFYESYNHYFPFPANFLDQWDICNLYPLLIHLNLFGTGYLSEITNTLKRFT